MLTNTFFAFSCKRLSFVWLNSFQSANTGLADLRRLLRERRVLLILDDVEPGNVSKVVDVDAIGTGSIVIITSRNREALMDAKCDIVEPLSGLGPNESAQLFKHHACEGGKELGVSQSMVDKVVQKCGGLPLSLKVSPR
jgi:hypothetical protein